MTRLCTLLIGFLLCSFSLQAQRPVKPNAVEIYKQLQELNFLGSALYLAAHPDDENTAMISYLSNELHARTGYLSLTRGDGGQNLIGSELGAQLGVIRTQELLAARSIDGGLQRFSRANDFGYSKNPEETLEIWDKEKVLSDVVWTIRNFKPDIIINRFDHRSPGTTHGHHTASAMLSVEAFDLTNDPQAFSEQLELTSLWQPSRQFFNTSWWFYGSREAFENADKENLVSLDVGVYYPGKGLSNTEISAQSRSQHKSQGFGNTGTRGSQTEYLELLKGSYPENGNLFEGIDTSWKRIKGGASIGQLLNRVEENFDFQNPAASLPELLKAYPLIKQLEDTHWQRIKTKQIEAIIKSCAGLYLEAVTNQQNATPNEAIDVTVEGINRSETKMVLQNIKINPVGTEENVDKILSNNEGFSQQITLNTGEVNLSSAYWLREEPTLGMYMVNDQELIGLPETPQQFKVIFSIKVMGTLIPFEVPLVYKYNDPVDGEVYEPFEIVPAVGEQVEESVIIFAQAEPKQVNVRVTSYKENATGVLRLKHSEDWKVSPAKYDITLSGKGTNRNYSFKVTPPENQQNGILEPVIELEGAVYDRKLERINYEHIPLQTLALPNASKVVRLDIKKSGEHIGYIAGAGDAVPESLRQIGYRVDMINPSTISAASLKNYDAVVMGIRAYNTVDLLRYKQAELLKYVNDGGTLVVQYNTARGFNFPNLGPYPLELSSKRVTDENARVTILDPDAPVLNYPNTINEQDFEGWVQERGLYFPEKWDDAYKPVLSINDKGEDPLKGSLLIASYGKGHYIYTGLSFFRELPAGVPGAYRLFANLLSLGKN